MALRWMSRPPESPRCSPYSWHCSSDRARRRPRAAAPLTTRGTPRPTDSASSTCPAPAAWCSRPTLSTPTTPGPHPALVFISSWGLNDAEYLVQARALAQAGYVVLSYTARGFWGSGGQIDTAGPPDIADTSGGDRLAGRQHRRRPAPGSASAASRTAPASA